MLDPEILAPERTRPLSVGEYMQLVDLGVFEDERVELLHGQLVTMSPQGPPHSLLTAWLARHLTIELGRTYLVRAHSPFSAPPDSMPEPDVIVALDDGSRVHPSRASLLIEVAESSLRKDRVIKTPIYAGAGVPEYWIVDVSRGVVHVLTGPSASGYQTEQTLTRGDILRPVALPGIEIPVADLPFDT